MRKHGGQIDELTALQPKLSKWDFWSPNRTRKTEFVAVVVDDQVRGVFQVVGILREGQAQAIRSASFAKSDPGDPIRDSRLYELKRMPSSAEGQHVSGWRVPRHSVQVLGHAIFREVSVPGPAQFELQGDVEASFKAQVERSRQSSAAELEARLSMANPYPVRRQVLAYAFDRNPDVVAAVLLRAKGVCENCHQPAPFHRKSDNSPFLEVHHKVTLADKGRTLS